jgi:hypothetical protein
MKSQISYVNGIAKEFHEFKVIEIINEKEVKEHLAFVYPYYAGTS